MWVTSQVEDSRKTSTECGWAWLMLLGSNTPTHFSLPEYFLRVKSLTTWDYGYVGLRWYFYQLKKLGRLTVCLLQAPWIGLAWQQRAGASMWHSAQRLEYILCNVQAVQTRIRLLYSNSKWLTEHKSHWSQQVSTIVATKLCVGRNELDVSFREREK